MVSGFALWNALVLSIYMAWLDYLGSLMTMFMCMQSYATRVMDVTTRNDFQDGYLRTWMDEWI